MFVSLLQIRKFDSLIPTLCVYFISQALRVVRNPATDYRQEVQ